MRAIFSILLFSLTMLSCNSVSESGGLEVLLTYQNYPVADEIISLNPGSIQKTTNNSGIAIFEDIDVGTYNVIAEHELFGAVSMNVEILEDEISQINLDFDPNFNGEFGIAIRYPEDGSMLASNTTNLFRCALINYDNQVETYKGIWSSSLDGELHTGNFSLGGYLSFTPNGLSPGDHTISLSVEDINGIVVSDEVNITVTGAPAAITLSIPDSEKHYTKLVWEHEEDGEFQDYKVFRREQNHSQADMIATIIDANTKTYDDVSAQAGISYEYHVEVTNVRNVKSISNEVSNSLYIPFVSMDYLTTRLTYDEQRNRLYSISRNNNLVFSIDVSNGEILETQSGFSTPTDFVMNADRSTLYVANKEAGRITRINLDNFSTSNIALGNTWASWTDKAVSVDIVEGIGIAYLADRPVGRLRYIDFSGNLLYKAIWQVSGEYIKTVPGTTDVLVHASNGVTRYSIVGDELNPGNSTDQGSVYAATFNISGNGDFLFAGNYKHFVSNLSSEIGSFDEVIWACNYDGTIAYGKEFMWDAENFVPIRPMPFESKVMHVSSDGKMLFTYDERKDKIFFLQIDNL